MYAISFSIASAFPRSRDACSLLQRRLLGLDRDGLARHAEDAGIALDLLERFLTELRSGGNGCAILAGPALDRLRRDSYEIAFAVSFVSNMAGVQLATQLFRESLGAPLLIPPRTRAIFQFLNPEARSNIAFSAPRDPSCWCAGDIVREAQQDYVDGNFHRPRFALTRRCAVRKSSAWLTRACEARSAKRIRGPRPSAAG